MAGLKELLEKRAKETAQINAMTQRANTKAAQKRAKQQAAIDAVTPKPPVVQTYAQAVQGAALAGQTLARQAEANQAARQETITRNQALLNEGYRPANLYDLTIGSLKRGYNQSILGQEYFKASQGRSNQAAQYEAKLAEEPYKFVPTNTLGRAVSGASELIGQMGRQASEPRTLGMATAAAGTAMLAGQAGPQALVPEEILTVPGAAFLGFKAGTALSNMEIEAGFAYKEMLDNGISPDTAKNISLGVGLVNGTLEFMQLDDLAKAFKLLKNNDATKSVASRLAQELTRRGVAVGRETAQEVAQEASTLTGVNLANYLEGQDLYTKEAVASRLADTALQSALSFGVLQTPAGVRNTYHILKTPQATRYADDAAAEQTAAQAGQSQTAQAQAQQAQAAQAASVAARRQAEILQEYEKVRAQQTDLAQALDAKQRAAQQDANIQPQRAATTQQPQPNVSPIAQALLASQQAQATQLNQTDRLHQAINQNRTQAQAQAQLPALWQAPIQSRINRQVENQIAAGHIDRRTEIEIKDKNVHAFQYDHPQIQPFYREQAQALLNDIQNGVKGKRLYNRDDEGYLVNVTGQKRFNSQPIEEMLDNGMRYEQIEKGLKRIIADNGQENMVTPKRIEKYLDKALSQGYRSMDGDIPINYEYLDAKSHIKGAAPNALYQDRETIDAVWQEAMANYQARQAQAQTQVPPQQTQAAAQNQVSGQPLLGDSLQPPKAARFSDQQQPQAEPTQQPQAEQIQAQQAQEEQQQTQAEQIRQIYDEQMRQAQAEQQPQAEPMQQPQAQNEQEPPHVSHDNPITDADPATLNSQSVRFIARAAHKSGLSYRIVEGLDDHIAAYIEGETIVYNARTLDDTQAVQKATAHEIYHSLLNTTEHAKLMDMACQYFIDNYGNGHLTLEALIAAKQAEYAENGVTLDNHAALDEIGADFMEIALSDERTANRILTEQPNLAKRILYYIQDKIRDYRTMRTLSEAQKRQYTMLRRAQTLYASGLKQAQKDRQANAQAETTRRYRLQSDITEEERSHLADLLRAGDLEQASLYRQEIGMSLMTYVKFQESVLPGFHKRQEEARQKRIKEQEAARKAKQLIQPKVQTYAQEQAQQSEEAAARQKVRERAEQAGYTTDDSYRMFHRAPNSTDGISQNLTDMAEVFGGENLYSDRAARLFGYKGITDTAEVIHTIQSARNNPDKPITIYRTIAAGVQDKHMRNGDWITTSLDYAKLHGESQFGKGNYRIITEQVPAKYVWNNGDSIYEFGYDDGKAYAYKNTANNKKSLDTVTYDDNGQAIPLNQRFDDQNPDPRYSLGNQSRFAELLDQYGAIEPGEAPHANRDARIPNQTNDFDRVRRFVRTAAEAQAVSDETIEAVQDEIGADVQDGLLTYEPESNKRLLKKADDDLARLGYDELFRQFTARFTSGERMTAKHIAQGERLLVEACQRRDVEGAKELIADIATIGTEMGQAVQALRLLKRMTPQGRLVAIQRLVTRINGQIEGRGKVELSDERIQDILSQDTPEGLDAAESRAISDIAEQVPATLEDKIRAWRYMSMLGNGRTLIRNTFGNFAFVPVRMIKNGMSLAGEKLLPAGSERTKVLHIKSEYRAFAESYFETIKDQLAQGNNYSDMFTRIEQEKRIFQNPALEKWRTTTTDLMKMTDMWVKKPAYIRAFASYLQANNFTPEYLQSGTRQAQRDFEAAHAHAWNEALKATYQEESTFANWLNKIEQENILTKIAIGGLMPFKKTPINIIKRGARYSPLGIVEGLSRGIYKLKRQEITPAEFIDHLTSGMTGTMIVGLGYLLASIGAIIPGDDDEPQKKQNYDRSLGAQNYAIKIPGGSVTIDWLAPAVMPLMVGAELHRQISQDKENDGGSTIGRVLESLEKLTDPVLEMSMMQGVLNTLQSFRDGSGQAFDLITSTVTSYGGQFIPTLAGQAARTLDDTRRSTYAPANSPITPTAERFLRQSAAKIPGLSKELEPQIDIWGNEQKQPGSNIGIRALNNFINPGTYKPDKTTITDQKLITLYDKTGKTKVLPATIGKTIDYDGKKYPLKASEYTAMQKQVGSKRYQDIQKFQQSTYIKHKELDDQAQANVIASLYEYRADQAKENYLRQKGIVYKNDAYYKIKQAESAGISPVDYLAIKQIFGGDYNKAKTMYDDSKYLGITPQEYLKTKKAFGESSGDTYDQAAHKLLISQAIGMTPQDYQIVHKTLGKIKGDEKEDGTTVKNSKRDNTFAYINTLPISKGAKAYLMYTRYPKTEDGQIARWLNTLPGMTKTQKEQLYQTKHNPNQTTYNRWIDTLNIPQEAKTKLKNRPYGAETAQIRRYINALPGLTKAQKQALWEQKAPE